LGRLKKIIIKGMHRSIFDELPENFTGDGGAEGCNHLFRLKIGNLMKN